jgi:hypothetical protein
MPFQPKNGHKYGYAEERHTQRCVCQEIRTRDQRDSAEQWYHRFLFPTVDEESRAYGAPDDRSDHRVGTAYQIFRQIGRWHEEL